MQILVTGGTGLIGTELIKFLKNHHQVTVLSRNADKVYLRNGYDVNAATSLDEVDFNHIDCVINLAGEPIADKRWSLTQKKRIEKSRWDITQKISDKIKRADSPPHTLISGSAIGYYGRQKRSMIDEEYTECYQEFSHQLCSKWESIANQAISGITRVCILRTGIVLSKEGGALSKMLPAYRFFMGGPMASGQQYMSWIHIDDMCAAILFLLNNRQLNGAFNLTAPNPVQNRVFSATLAQILKRPNFARLPKKVLETLFGEMSDLLIYGQNVVPKRLLDEGYRFHYPKLKSALESLLRD